MHQPIRENLEDYLTGSTRRVPQEFHAHLAACEDCAIEVRLMEAQAGMLRSLQCDECIEPRAGFYARVMDRIAEQAPASIWSIFLIPSFGRRLAIASAALVVLLGTYLVTTESSEPELATNSSVVLNEDSQPSETQASPQVSAQTAAFDQESLQNQDSLQRQRRRDALLVNLASYNDNLQSLRQ